MSATDGLRELVERTGPFVTLVVAARSDRADADLRFDIECKNALSEISDAWRTEHTDALEQALGDTPHDLGESIVAIQDSAGTIEIEPIGVGVHTTACYEQARPRLAPLIEARQEVVPHVVVETDNSGADLTAFAEGLVVDDEQIVVENRHIHKSRQGGWSHRRFQQRAENSWEDNANNVAESATEMASGADASIVFVAGPTRAQSMVTERLEEQADLHVVKLEEGSPDGISEAVIAELRNVVATRTKELLDEFRTRLANGAASNTPSDIERAFTEGRVETLLVHDDGAHGDDRLVDRCIEQALLTDAGVRIVSNVADLTDGVAALYRW